jgi:Coenzyme PQQ synthesis protein D (PqqD)
MVNLGAVPRLQPGVLFESTPEQSYLYDSSSQSYALLDNEAAIEIIRLCDGDNSVRTICERLAILYDLPLEQIQEDVLEMLRILAREAFIDSTTDDA